MLSFQTILFALLGGVLPALLWLWFWLKQDKKRPEPRGLILLAFVVGMIAVPVVLPFEKFADSYFTGTAVIIIWSAIEEIFKYTFAYFAVLRRKAMDEPVDAVIYMITVALGFAALENTLFLINPITDGSFVDTIINGNLRFLGATLLHTLSSATIGVMIALSFYRKKALKKVYVVYGLIMAILLHSLFNFFIMKGSGDKLLTIFVFVWIGIVILILLFEKIKRIRNKKLIIK
ncbi:PrsW family intramembrane metalloprotease [bacterium]|nr:PrsW family intramembrane metalloprotease [bacterium]MBT3730032.1 PrsW family intramembrane metalloprotease [bacterium]MBT4895008.1 PrsW family intramembrane metalloprotease [bacterium]